MKSRTKAEHVILERHNGTVTITRQTFVTTTPNYSKSYTGGREVIFVLSMQNFVGYLLTFSASSH